MLASMDSQSLGKAIRSGYQELLQLQCTCACSSCGSLIQSFDLTLTIQTFFLDLLSGIRTVIGIIMCLVPQLSERRGAATAAPAAKPAGGPAGQVPPPGGLLPRGGGWVPAGCSEDRVQHRHHQTACPVGLHPIGPHWGALSPHHPLPRPWLLSNRPSMRFGSVPSALKLNECMNGQKTHASSPLNKVRFSAFRFGIPMSA